jgi:glycosyltransferase involved in cell wall biosynthesis
MVLPAFNEDANIARAVRDAAAAAAALADDYEVVAVDDGSRDRTAVLLDDMARELAPRLILVRHQRNRGYGAALRSGFAATRGELVFYTDSDNQFDLAELRDFLPLMAEWDAVLGYRLNRQDAWTRRAASALFNWLSAVAFGMAVRDLNCSFKLFRGDLLRNLPLEADDFFIDTEMVARMHRGGWRYVQRGVHHFPRTAGRSSVRVSDVPRTLAAIARFWFRLRVRPASRVTA